MMLVSSGKDQELRSRERKRGSPLDSVLPSYPKPGTNPGTGTAYHPTALPTVGPYAPPVPGFERGPERRGVDWRVDGMDLVISAGLCWCASLPKSCA